MPHLILGNRFGYYDRPAWHEIGESFPHGISAEDALTRIDGDFPIHKIPAYAEINNAKIMLDKHAIIRPPLPDDNEYRHIGTVSPDYDLIQNRDLAKVVDQLLDAGKWRLETLGILELGKTIFFLCKVNETYSVCKEDVELYFLITDNKGGTESLRFVATPVRVVCKNTLSLSLRRIQAQVEIPHRRGMLFEASWRMDVIRQATESGNNIIQALKGLEGVDKVDLPEYVEYLFPTPTPPRSLEMLAADRLELREKAERAEYAYVSRCKQMEAARGQVSENFERLNEFPISEGWRAFNAATQYLDHQKGNGYAIRAKDTLFGKSMDIRNKAYEYLMKG